MKNLKKVLSMSLAVIMMLGMLVTSNAANMTSSDLTDMDEVVNSEAVSLLVDLGIILGIEQADGTFAYKPAQGINRASYAKMIYYILMGERDHTPYVGLNAGLNDVAGHWAEGFINYIASAGIVVGDHNGNFNPDAEIDTVSAAKMLLVALGYNSADRNYENHLQWSLNIMRDAQNSGLLNGVTNTAGQVLSRDNAAQMIFNTLFATTRTATYGRDQGEQYVTGYTVNPTTLGLEVYGLVRVTAALENITASGADLDGKSITPADKGGALAAAIAAAEGSEFRFSPAMVGANINFYAKVSYEVDNNSDITMTFLSLYSEQPAQGTAKILASTTNGFADAEAFVKATTDKKDKTFLAELDEGAAFYLNGERGNDAIIAEMVAGAIVEFIDSNNNGKADVVRVTRKSVDFVTGAIASRVSAGVTQIRIPGVVDTYTAVSKLSGYEDLKKDDVVLLVKIGDVTYLEKAASLNGSVTATNNLDQLRIGGKFYGQSGLVGTTLNASAWSDFSNEYTFYLDDGKHIVAAVRETDNISDNLLVVLQAVWVEGSGAIGSSNYAEAKILLTDGTTEIVKITTLGGVDLSNSNIANVSANKFYNYRVDSNGAYELAIVNDGTANVNSANIEKGKVLFDGATIGNANTVFVYATVSGNTTTYKTVSGIANVPNMTVKAVAKTDVVVDGNIATYVYLDVVTLAGDAGEYFFVPDATSYVSYPAVSGSNIAYREYDVVIDGVETTIKLDASKASSIASGGLYEASTKDGNGIVTAVSADKLAAAVTGINVASGGTLSVGSNPDVYSYGTDTVVYTIEEGELNVSDSASLKADANDLVLVLSDKGYAQTIYVIVVAD